MKDCEQIQMGFYQDPDNRAKMLPVSYTEWEEKAKEILAAGPFGYVNGAAGAGDTMKANEDAFKRYRIRPRICRDTTKRSMEISLFGNKYPVPILFAPIGVNSIVHCEAEVPAAKAAASLGMPYILSNVSTVPMEKIAEVMGDSPRWFQLYPPKDRELTKSFLKRAETAGFSAIVVTIDSTLLGWREQDLRNAFLPFLTGQGMGNYFSDPVFLSILDQRPEEDLKAACQKALAEGNNTCFSWKDLEYITQQTELPVLLKGVTHPDDALLAAEHGAAGIVVSNHGGRQLDGAIATLEALPSVCEAIEHKIPVLLDSGIRRGADVLKALALGASAVLVGRPYIYGLAVAGEAGVKAVAENLIAETELQMAICGRKSIEEIDSSLVLKM
ncbi:alpha-hydroxy-acid oxidizing protein [Mesobacillus foraminis]|uniref:L-lactate oxidase n=2 Tax=Mesobacillus foraminis TaxID=279826 RepID=A0A4R2B7L5_9BACI|nr:alpha-hydroxy-acid oxidizing protein [Mesobacillus foraminis]TCN22687.1 isopentenyl diphosphate isomerase/L-lactate dehydrogenase-like FMN-dependent dehydrogenase [Mesobacillus foraminis]